MYRAGPQSTAAARSVLKTPAKPQVHSTPSQPLVKKQPFTPRSVNIAHTSNEKTVKASGGEGVDQQRPVDVLELEMLHVEILQLEYVKLKLKDTMKHQRNHVTEQFGKILDALRFVRNKNLEFEYGQIADRIESMMGLIAQIPVNEMKFQETRAIHEKLAYQVSHVDDFVKIPSGVTVDPMHIQKELERALRLFDSLNSVIPSHQIEKLLPVFSRLSELTSEVQQKLQLCANLKDEAIKYATRQANILIREISNAEKYNS
jgi:hypothetical protein